MYAKSVQNVYLKIILLLDAGGQGEYLCETD